MSLILFWVSPLTLNNLPPKAYSVTVNNGASKTMGLISTNFNATLNNPFSSVASSLGIGLSASVKNNNLRAWNTSYSQSIGDRGAIFSFAGLIADAEPKGSLKALGIVSRSYSLAPRIRFPIKKATSSGNLILLSSAFLSKIATRISSSGGSITTVRPQLNLVLNLSSTPGISLG